MIHTTFSGLAHSLKQNLENILFPMSTGQMLTTQGLRDMLAMRELLTWVLQIFY